MDDRETFRGSHNASTRENPPFSPRSPSGQTQGRVSGAVLVVAGTMIAVGASAAGATSRPALPRPAVAGPVAGGAIVAFSRRWELAHRGAWCSGARDELRHGLGCDGPDRRSGPGAHPARVAAIEHCRRLTFTRWRSPLLGLRRLGGFAVGSRQVTPNERRRSTRLGHRLRTRPAPAPRRAADELRHGRQGRGSDLAGRHLRLADAGVAVPGGHRPLFALGSSAGGHVLISRIVAIAPGERVALRLAPRAGGCRRTPPGNALRDDRPGFGCRRAPTGEPLRHDRPGSR